MRSSKILKNDRLVHTDIKRLQKSMKQKTDKEVQSLIQLIDLPDFDISQFFQTLLKNPKYDEVLSKIPKQKQIDFFSRNFITFIETQDQLAQLKPPQLQEIPKAKQFKFEQKQLKKQQQDVDQSSVTQIIDSFGAAVLQKNNQQILRILQIINQMKQHSRYQKYFNLFSINQLFRQSYQTFLQTCQDRGVLLSVGEILVALKKYVKQKTDQFINKIRTDMNIDNSARGIKKIMQRLIQFIQNTLKQIKQQFPIQKITNPIQIDILIPKFLADISKQFYQTIQPCIYQKQQLSQILQILQIVLQSSTQMQSKGINLLKDFKQLISHDLPIHMNKIIQVVIQAFDDILKQDNSLYQFKFFDSLNSLGSQIQLLYPIKDGQYGKKCCSKKGILLINAFVVILQPLCDNKWSFLHQNVIEQLLDKVSHAIYQSNWHYWDYYQLFYFFQRLKSGRIKHKKIYNQSQIPQNLKQKMNLAQKISLDCWENFQTKLTNKFWTQILSKIPKNLWEIKDYITTTSQPQQKPTIFGIQIVFSMQTFLKDIQFRLQKPQFQHIITRFYQYIMYLIEYVIYYEYHSKGTKQKVFSLYQRSQRIFKKVKNFSIQQLDIIKQHKKILSISIFSKSGVKNFALDLYYFTEVYKLLTEYSKISADQFVFKIAQVQAKQHKSQPVNVAKQQFTKPVQGCIKVFKEQPQKIRQYMEKKRKDLNKSSK